MLPCLTMKRGHKPIPMKLLQESLVLDESLPTCLRWKTRPASHFQDDRRLRQANSRCAGKPAGTIAYSAKEKRHLGSIYFGGKEYALSRIVFALANGYDPGSRDVDHIDGDRSNNNPSNLRAITHAQNCMNRNHNRNPASGVSGVYWLESSGRWIANITANKKPIYLGCFKEKEDAITARREAEVKHHGEYALSVSRVVLDGLPALAL